MRICMIVFDLLKSKNGKQACNDFFQADAIQNFFLRMCCSIHKKHDKREPGLLKEEFRCTQMICLCSETYFCYDAQFNKYKFSSKGLNKRTLEENGYGPMEKYRCVMDEIINLTSTNRWFRTMTIVLLRTIRQRRDSPFSTLNALFSLTVFI